MSPAGIISVVAGVPGAGWCSASGNRNAAFNIRFNSLWSLASDGNGGILVVDFSSHLVRQITPTALAMSMAGTGSSSYLGDGGPASSATFRNPGGIFSDGNGGFFVSDYNNRAIRRMIPSGAGYSISTIAGGNGIGYSCVIIFFALTMVQVEPHCSSILKLYFLCFLIPLREQR